jgi:hypothetical protein
MNLIYAIIRLFKQKKGHGFKGVKIDYDHDFMFGDGQLEERFGAAKQVIKENGQWDPYLPEAEYQKFDWGDTMHCTVYGTENCEQTLMKAKYGESQEYSERFLGVQAGITQGGGSPHKVAEAWRRDGNLEYSLLPFEDANSWEEFNSPNPMTPELLNSAARWSSEWEFGHDWITPGIMGGMAGAIKHALKYSPVGVGVYAWASQDGYYVKPSWARDNHWVMCYGYVDGEYWKVYDHYDQVHKKIAWDYPWAFAKRYTLEKKNQEQEDKGYDLFKRLEGMHIHRAHAKGEIYYVGPEEVVFEGWWSNSPWLKGGINEWLREQEQKGNFTGISEQDFEDLTSYIELAGIPFKDDGLSAVNKLNEK